MTTTTLTSRPTTNAAPTPTLTPAQRILTFLNGTSEPTPDWDLAACAGRDLDPEVFFPIGDTAQARQQVDQARLLCARCPIRQDCLSWALATGQDKGVWGGLTEKERRTVHQRRTTEWGRTRNVAEKIYTRRLGEFTSLLDRGASVTEIAAVFGTNVQTVNRVLERIEAAKTAGGVKTA